VGLLEVATEGIRIFQDLQFQTIRLLAIRIQMLWFLLVEVEAELRQIPQLQEIMAVLAAVAVAEKAADRHLQQELETRQQPLMRLMEDRHHKETMEEQQQTTMD
jgi:hypothetical protein